MPATVPKTSTKTDENELLGKRARNAIANGIERIIQKLREAKNPIKTMMEFETNRMEFKTRTENEEITVIIEPLKK